MGTMTEKVVQLGTDTDCAHCGQFLALGMLALVDYRGHTFCDRRCMTLGTPQALPSWRARQLRVGV